MPAEGSQLVKWLLVGVAVVMALLSVVAMVFGFQGGWLVNLAFAVSGVLIIFLSVLIVAGVFVPYPLCIITAYYYDAVLFFYNLVVLILIFVYLIAGRIKDSKTVSESGGDRTTKETKEAVVGIAEVVVCLLLEVLLVAAGYLLYKYAAAHQELPLSHTPLDMLKCRCFRKRPAGSVSADADAPTV